MHQAPYGTSGVCPNTEHWITEGQAAMNEFHDELHEELSAEPNYPINAPGPWECNASLPDCFGSTVYLKDFSGYGKDNPMSIDEFTEFADKVAADLCLHDLTWPGFSAGRQVYDTPFYNGGGSERRGSDPKGLWPSDQQVCIETLGCSGRSEINYLAQGMWGAAKGEPLPVSEAIVRSWKFVEYQEAPSEGSLKWLRWGYEYYQRYKEEHKQ